MSKVAVILGSPRKNGNTALLVNEAVKAMRDSGVESEVFYLNEMKIKGCQACYHCKKNETTECKLKDDMKKVHQAIEEADGVLVATPIYWGHVTAQTKTWLDRMFPYVNIKLRSYLPKGKKMSFIFTQNQPNEELFKPAIESFKYILKLIGFKIQDTLIANDLDMGAKPMASEYPELMRKAYEIGKSLC